MSILREHIGVMRKEELTSHQPELTTFFLEALDFRTQHAEVGVFPPACPEVTTQLRAREKFSCVILLYLPELDLDVSTLANKLALLFLE